MCLVLLYHRIGSKDLLGNDSDILLNCQKICPGALQIPPKEGQKPDTTGQSRLSTYGQDYPTDDLISLINFDPDFTKLPTPLAEDEQKANKLSLKLFVLDCVYHQVCLKQLQAEKLEKIKGELNTLQGQTPHLIVKAKAEGIKAVIAEIQKPAATVRRTPQAQQPQQPQQPQFISSELPRITVQPFPPIYDDTSKLLQDVSTNYSSVRTAQQGQAPPRQGA